MSDSLVLTGTRQVTKHTGTEMTRIDSPRGGNTWQLKRWWSQGNGTVYTNCTMFKVEAGGATGYLAIENISEGVEMQIVHDGSFNFNFWLQFCFSFKFCFNFKFWFKFNFKFWFKLLEVSGYS